MMGKAFATRTEAGRALARRLVAAAYPPPVVVLA
ncbi:MAG: phosphoribosyltransferase, partial [Rubrivivax sp.]|nr:phosphoribosyltransferase [Rubrivivax sp.]